MEQAQWKTDGRNGERTIGSLRRKITLKPMEISNGLKHEG